MYIIEKLLKKWAPEVIAGRLKSEYPFDRRYHISHESIYQWIYATSKKHKIKLYTLLSYSKKIRYRRRYKRGRRINIPDRKSIHTRPKEVSSRKTFGHWEADLLVGKNAASYVLNIHERQKRFIVSQKLTDKKTDSVVRAFQNAFGDIPNEMIKTITVDNGIEFVCFKQLEELFECEVYFADPYASYQKGGIEHNNMLLRRRFRKSTDFRNVSEKELQQEVNKRNNIPRKVLNYLTPYETFPTSVVALKT